MNKTIVVKGIGKASTRPDTVMISMYLETTDFDYQKAMEKASDSIDKITKCLGKVGIDKKDLKTTAFNVQTLYNSHRRKDGSYYEEFKGYKVNHNLQLLFDFDTKLLSLVLGAIGGCEVHPRFNIQFTVRDSAAINEEMLRSATANARRKAEILCEASGKKLGELISIDYDWGEIDIYSNTRYIMEDRCMLGNAEMSAMEIEPEDIETSDTVTFVWEID